MTEQERPHPQIYVEVGALLDSIARTGDPGAELLRLGTMPTARINDSELNGRHIATAPMNDEAIRMLGKVEIPE